MYKTYMMYVRTVISALPGHLPTPCISAFSGFPKPPYPPEFLPGLSDNIASAVYSIPVGLSTILARTFSISARPVCLMILAYF